MSTLDTIAGIALGSYLVAVSINGNSEAMIEQAKKNTAFLKWGVAVGIAAYLYGIPSMRGPMTLIIAVAFLGLFLQHGTQITQAASDFWGSLSGATQ
jgi:hypothetical protein